MHKTLMLICATAAVAVALAVPTEATNRPPVDGQYYQCPGNSLIVEMGVDLRSTYPGLVGEFTIFHLIPESAGQSIWEDLRDSVENLLPDWETLVLLPFTGVFGGGASYVEDINRNREVMYERFRDEFSTCSNLHPFMLHYRKVWELRARTGLSIPLPEIYRVMSWESIYIELDCHVAGASFPRRGENQGGPVWSLEGHRGDPPNYPSLIALARIKRCAWK